MKLADGGSGRTLLEVLGVGAGLAAYAYTAGGIVEHLRFAGEGLPATQALALLSARQLLVVGVIVLLAAIPVSAALIAIHWLWGQLKRLRHRHSSAKAAGRHPVGDAATAGAAAASVSALAAAVLGLLEAAGGVDVAAALRAVLSAVGVAGGIGGFLGIALSGLAAAGLRGLLALPGRWVTAGLLVLVLVGGASLAYFVPLSMSGTVLRLENGTCVAGLFLARDGSNVQLVDGRSKRLVVIEGVDLAEIGHSTPVEGSTVKPVPCPVLLRSAPRGSL